MKLAVKIVAIGVVVVSIVVVAVAFLHGHTWAVLSPKGPVATHERNLIIVASALSLLVVIPVFALTIGIAWRYRATNPKANYQPDWDHNRVAETIWWGLPSALILGLAILTWTSTHSLDPAKPLASNVQPITIQVVALNWKWLFIYPDQNIASVNLVEFPQNTPVRFEITSDAPMNSFWIPQLGSQIYAMSGMSTELNLMATSLGDFSGSSANLSGIGFAGMKFVARSTTTASFHDWVTSVRTSNQALDSTSYHELAKPSQDNPAAYYAPVKPNLYDEVVISYMTPTIASSVGAYQP